MAYLVEGKVAYKYRPSESLMFLQLAWSVPCSGHRIIIDQRNTTVFRQCKSSRE